MNMPITAEGIETAEVLAELRTLGKFKGQGYFYGRPCTGAQVREMLAEKRLLLTAETTPLQLEARPDASGEAASRSGTHG
jgi:predicted signal transduction protein with EAL and GGDEF domain